MKALFLDRDGVINERLEGAYVRSVSEFKLIHDVLPIISHAQKHDYLCILISNQQGVGKGIMTASDLDAVTTHMQQTLVNHGLRPLDEVYYCTDLEQANSPRRKPAPGMLLEAIANNNLIPESCWFLGDSLSDAQAGKGAMVNTALVGHFDAGDATLIAQTLSEMFLLLERNLL